MSRDSSTTHSTVASRRSSAQIPHSGALGHVPASLAERTLALASVIARASRRRPRRGSFSRWKAIRCADFGPIPGSRPSSSINACTSGAYVDCHGQALLHDLGPGEGAGEAFDRRDVVLGAGVDQLGRVHRLLGIGRRARSRSSPASSGARRRVGSSTNTTGTGRWKWAARAASSSLRCCSLRWRWGSLGTASDPVPVAHPSPGGQGRLGLAGQAGEDLVGPGQRQLRGGRWRLGARLLGRGRPGPRLRRRGAARRRGRRGHCAPPAGPAAPTFGGERSADGGVARRRARFAGADRARSRPWARVGRPPRAGRRHERVPARWRVRSRRRAPAASELCSLQALEAGEQGLGDGSAASFVSRTRATSRSSRGSGGGGSRPACRRAPRWPGPWLPDPAAWPGRPPVRRRSGRSTSWARTGRGRRRAAGRRGARRASAGPAGGGGRRAASARAVSAR